MPRPHRRDRAASRHDVGWRTADGIGAGEKVGLMVGEEIGDRAKHHRIIGAGAQGSGVDAGDVDQPRGARTIRHRPGERTEQQNLMVARGRGDRSIRVHRRACPLIV